jgi:hypothetical protein
MEQNASQPVTERIFAPNCRVEHERGEMERTIAVKFVLSDHAQGEHIAPMRWRVDVIAVDNLSDRVVDKTPAQGREVKRNHCHKNGSRTGKKRAL